MKKLLVILFTMLLGICKSFAFEMVLPKEKKAIVTTNYAFFVGKASAGESLTINDEHIYIASNGAFAHSVKLKDGENRIVIRSNYTTRIYKIFRNKPVQEVQYSIEEFDPAEYTVISDNTPLRSTPVDYGMNRMSHLFKGTNLIINGSKGGFYRVFLSNKKIGWIAKDAVILKQEKKEVPKFITMNSETFKNASKHTIEFTDKLPYTIEESDKEIVFKVYNPQASDNSVYTVNIRKPEKYTYTTVSSNGVYVFKVCSIPLPENKNLEGLTIFVDPGHGGSEYGAIGCLGDKEKDINLKIAYELKNLLEVMGAKVVMSRECDGSVSLDDRVKMARDNCANIFVSIHLNSIPDIEMNIHKNRGSSVYYYNTNSRDLAKAVEKTLTEQANTKNNGVRTASFAVLRPTDYVGILVETAYMTNPLDSVLYRSEDFAQNAAKGIANGILKYVNDR